MMQTPREMQAVHVERRISIHIFYNRQKSRIRDAMAHPLSGFCAWAEEVDAALISTNAVEYFGDLSSTPPRKL